jgi:hypothetical protein
MAPRARARPCRADDPGLRGPGGPGAVGVPRLRRGLPEPHRRESSATDDALRHASSRGGTSARSSSGCLLAVRMVLRDPQATVRLLRSRPRTRHADHDWSRSALTRGDSSSRSHPGRPDDLGASSPRTPGRSADDPRVSTSPTLRRLGRRHRVLADAAARRGHHGRARGHRGSGDATFTSPATRPDAFFCKLTTAGRRHVQVRRSPTPGSRTGTTPSRCPARDRWGDDDREPGRADVDACDAARIATATACSDARDNCPDTRTPARATPTGTGSGTRARSCRPATRRSRRARPRP